MLDVYQVEGIVKQAQAEFRQNFEKDYPHIIEFLTEKIIEQAKLGETVVILPIEKIIIQSKIYIDSKKIIKYLTIKGFYIDEYMDHEVIYNGTEKTLNPIPSIKIRWPRG
jgi:hypothetical protein